MTRSNALVRRKSWPIAALAALVGLGILGVLPGLYEALPYLLPAFALLLGLLARGYPGERRLLSLIARARRPRRRAAAHSFARGRPRAIVPRGGSLIGSALAVRPPPRPHLAPN